MCVETILYANPPVLTCSSLSLGLFGQTASFLVLKWGKCLPVCTKQASTEMETQYQHEGLSSKPSSQVGEVADGESEC